MHQKCQSLQNVEVGTLTEEKLLKQSHSHTVKNNIRKRTFLCRLNFLYEQQ